MKTPTTISEEIFALQIPKEQRRRHDDGFIGRRQNRALACGNKIGYTYEYAQEVVKRFRRNHSRRMAAYRCRHCQSWHVGNPVEGT